MEGKIIINTIHHIKQNPERPQTHYVDLSSQSRKDNEHFPSPVPSSSKTVSLPCSFKYIIPKHKKAHPIQPLETDDRRRQKKSSVMSHVIMDI